MSEPVSRTISEPELALLRGAVAWLEGYVLATRSELPKHISDQINRLDEWTGQPASYPQPTEAPHDR